MGVDYNYRVIGRYLEDATTGYRDGIQNDPRPEVAAIGALLVRLRDDEIWFALDECAEYSGCVDETSKARAASAWARFVELTRDIVTPAMLVAWSTERAEKAAADARAAADVVDAMIAKARNGR